MRKAATLAGPWRAHGDARVVLGCLEPHVVIMAHPGMAVLVPDDGDPHALAGLKEAVAEVEQDRHVARDTVGDDQVQTTVAVDIRNRYGQRDCAHGDELHGLESSVPVAQQDPDAVIP